MIIMIHFKGNVYTILISEIMKCYIKGFESEYKFPIQCHVIWLIVSGTDP